MNDEEYLIKLARNGDFADALKFMENHPGLDVNHKVKGWSLIQYACFGHEDFNNFDLVKMILANPQIDVNIKCDLHLPGVGQTPFSLACENNSIEVIELLLSDPRVDVNMPDSRFNTALWWAASMGRMGVVKLLLTHERDISWEAQDMKNLKEIWKYSDIHALIHKFYENPVFVRHQLRLQLKISTALSATLFALVVFLCDELLEVHNVFVHASAAYKLKEQKFFDITRQLPMELQMIVCNMAYGLNRQHILTKHSEPAFFYLAMKYENTK
jgi:ankyrin repeat protein